MMVAERKTHSLSPSLAKFGPILGLLAIKEPTNNIYVLSTSRIDKNRQESTLAQLDSLLSNFPSKTRIVQLLLKVVATCN
jgi:hypothetical protein